LRQRAFTACSCVFKEITLVWANQGNYFENATACSKRTLKTTVATQLKPNYIKSNEAKWNHSGIGNGLHWKNLKHRLESWIEWNALMIDVIKFTFRHKYKHKLFVQKYSAQHFYYKKCCLRYSDEIDTFSQFYEQLLCQYSFAKKLQSQTVNREKLQRFFRTKNATCKILVKLRPDIIEFTVENWEFVEPNRNSLPSGRKIIAGCHFYYFFTT